MKTDAGRLEDGVRELFQLGKTHSPDDPYGQLLQWSGLEIAEDAELDGLER